MVTSEERMSRLEGAYEQVDRRLDDMNHRFDEMDRRFTEMRGEMDRRFTEMRSEMNSGFTEMRREMNSRFNSLMVLIGGGVDYGDGGHHRPHCHQLRPATIGYGL